MEMEQDLQAWVRRQDVAWEEAAEESVWCMPEWRCFFNRTIKSEEGRNGTG